MNPRPGVQREAAMTERSLFVGLDVGGTTIKAGVIDESGKVHGRVVIDTEAARGQEHGLRRMEMAVREATAKAGVELTRIAALGVATPGTMDIREGIIIDPPNLKPWKNVAVRRHLEGVFGKPTGFQNDANAAAYGEYCFGAGRGVRSMALFTLGTGVGGGIVLDGEVLEGEHSHAAELGHAKVEVTQPRQCNCGQRGCLEAYASATAVVKRTCEALAVDANRSSRLHDLALLGQDLTAQAVFKAADEGDDLARRIVDETAMYLAVGAANVMHTIDPELIVFGGGMMGAGEPFLRKIRGFLREVALPIPAERTKVRLAELGADAGFIGAAACGIRRWRNVSS
jgi:glucokinase